MGSTSNSNTIALVRDGQLRGNDVGQQDRVGRCELAVKRVHDAGLAPVGAVAYSDQLFPVPRPSQVLIDAGIRAIFCTNSSVRDGLVLQRMLDGGIAVAQVATAMQATSSGIDPPATLRCAIGDREHLDSPRFVYAAHALRPLLTTRLLERDTYAVAPELERRFREDVEQRGATAASASERISPQVQETVRSAG